MTCRDVMTANPSCCVPSDSVAMAAQIMKREDVGPVLIVSDYNSRNLAGIVTDRDLAIKVIADGRDPHNTRLDEVMSHNPVTCRENDSTDQALRVMAEYQVRRIPVVDSGNRLVGIIAQADLARRENEEEVGEMVEEISQPYGSGWWSGRSEPQEMPWDSRESARSFTRASSAEASSRTASLAIGAVCLGVGAGLMYLFDPNRGRTRRAIARDKAAGWYNASGEAVARTTQDLRNRAAGVATTTKHIWKSEPVSDEKLQARVRSKMGRYVSHPHAVRVDAHDGNVTLSGSILAHEVDSLMRCVRGISGVQEVENRLEVQDMGQAISNPNLQGSARKPGEQWDIMKKNWSPTTRVMASAVGGGMMLYGLKAHSRLGKATTALGLGLLTRGLTNRELAEMQAMSPLRRWGHV
jgi:CBS domain-containing protein/osmotically-inducible protein OsmY